MRVLWGGRGRSCEGDVDGCDVAGFTVATMDFLNKGGITVSQNDSLLPD